MSGVVSLAGEVSTLPEVQPFWHKPPRLAGKSRGVTVVPDTLIPHCKAQYGQCVSTLTCDFVASVTRTSFRRFRR